MSAAEWCECGHVHGEGEQCSHTFPSGTPCPCNHLRALGVKAINLDRHLVSKILLKIHGPSVYLGILLMWLVAWMSR